MNWTSFQTYKDAPAKAFEILCNQLFENWCKEEYSTELVSFQVVNGAGGDGGVESYAVLSGGKTIGLQAKWFPDSIGSNQIGQIKNSIETALKIRPQISRYIVCIPRDLASLTAKGSNTEDKRWKDMRSSILTAYPNLEIELWNETRLTQELQKDCSSGIFKFWFERAEISDESVKFSFDKSKKSWLSAKYVPELNTFGKIHRYISTYLGNIDQWQKLSKSFSEISTLCDDFCTASDELIDVCGESDPYVMAVLQKSKFQIQAMQHEAQKIQSWLGDLSPVNFEFDEPAFQVNFNGIKMQLRESKEEYAHYFHFAAVIKVLQLFEKIQIRSILNQIKFAKDCRSIIFLGEPGTGKTHGISAETERLLDEGYHIPILIQARDVSATASWKDVLISTLGLSDVWSEEDIWQGLSSLANRKRIHALDAVDHVTVVPKVIIIVDGIDESSLHDKWIERVQETSAIVQSYPLLRFCFMSRPYVFRGKDTGAKEINIDVNGDVPAYKLFDSYIKAYHVNVSCAGWVKYALTTPLALKLFCELNEGKSITYHSGADVSIAALLKEKISMLEKEYCKQSPNITIADQYIYKAILQLTNLFSQKSRLERNQTVDIIAQTLSIDTVQSKRLLEYLANYGVLRLYCEHQSGLLALDVYFYYPGIQGYFDYASALVLIDKYTTPQNIDFDSCKNIPHDAYYILAIISAQNFSYLITKNTSINGVVSKAFKKDLTFFALRHMKSSDAEQYKQGLLKLMGLNRDTLLTITNNIVLPLSRESQHPLGVLLLNEFLLGFEQPAQRDILWSMPSGLRGSEKEKWYSSAQLAIGNEAYDLTDTDTAEGLPVVYAWALSSVDNAQRKMCRTALLQWALRVPGEFYALFLKFSSINDPQIKSDLYSILMSLLFEIEDLELLQSATGWLMENILGADKIEKNRDIAIRHYATSIVQKAQSLGVIDSETAMMYLPPFKLTSNCIALSAEALAGTYMGGYKGITYDLGRYVLIDHITHVFPDHGQEVAQQYERLIESISANRPEFTGISSSQLILSAAYEFIITCGWNEKEFLNYNTKEKNVYGADVAISRSYSPQTHGSQSPVMTVCEKYVWQARNYISGFLADNLMYVDDDGASHVCDYGLLDDFLIPALEIGQINPESMKDLYPWHIPEKDSVIISGKPNSQDDVVTAIRTAPNITWGEWVQIDNSSHQYPVDEDKLIVLTGFSCFESSSGMETNLYINTVLISEKDLDSFIDAMSKTTGMSNSVINPLDWKGNVQAECYITPKEICWMPWKKRYDSWNVDEFPTMKINSAVDQCTYNFLEYGDVGYDLPAAPIRDFLKITNTNGYEFYGENKQIKAINVFAGENWRTQQSQLLTNHSLLEVVRTGGKVLVWIMREQRLVNAKARERFGDFYEEKDYSYIGFYKDGKFVVIQIPQKKNEEVDLADIRKRILAMYEGNQ